MKNIIALSTILAAGTLCANAATNLSADILKSASSSITTSTTFSSSTTSYPLLTSINATGGNFTVSLDITGLAESYSTATCLFSLKLLYGASYSNYTNVEFVLSGTGIYVKQGATALSTSSDYKIADISAFTGLKVGTLEIVSSRVDSTNTLTTYVNGGLSDTFSGDVGINDYALARLQIGSSTADSEETNRTSTNLSAGTVSNVYVWTSALTAAQVATIPEPSMFGLLAGTLALGLAGTRRRKRH